MKIIEPKVELINPPAYSDLLSLIELAGRTCYKSESKITGDSAEKFVRNILKRGHEAVIEHGSVSVRFTCDRGVSHEIVRPSTMAKGSVAMPQWIAACKQAEFSYFAMLDYGCTPQEARSVLPNSTKTEVVMTANMREWRHFLRLRTAPAAHPDMREVAKMLLAEMQTRYPAFFEDFEV